MWTDNDLVDVAGDTDEVVILARERAAFKALVILTL